MCPRRLQIRSPAASVRLGAGEPVLHRGLQRGQEEPGPGVPLRGGSPVLGSRATCAEGLRGQHDSERETGPISRPFADKLE